MGTSDDLDRMLDRLEEATINIEVVSVPRVDVRITKSQVTCIFDWGEIVPKSHSGTPSTALPEAREIIQALIKEGVLPSQITVARG